MFENAEPQGLNLGSTQEQNAAVVAAAVPARKAISADSFRKLSALLKKPVAIPELLTVTTPEPIQVAIPEPKIEFLAVATAPEPTISEPTMVASVPEISIASPTDAVPEPEIAITPSIVVASEPVVLDAPSVIAISEPTIAIAEPVITISEPSISISPSVTKITEPAISISQPDIKVSEPVISITPSSVINSEPVVSVIPSVITTSEPSNWVTPSVITTSEPSISISQPAIKISEPETSISPSVITTSEPSISVTPSVIATSLPAISISQPAIKISEPEISPSVITASEPAISILPSTITISEPAISIAEAVVAVEPATLQIQAEPESVKLEEVAPAAVVKSEPSAQQPRPRDAFALPPSAMPQGQPKPAPIVVAQTPQQEQESAELARSLLDMMASGSSSGLPQERALAADTLLRMIPRLPLKSMVMLAERLCMMEAPPHLLVTKLICDPRIEVAGPLLEDCSHITDEDLSLVIHEGDSAKRRMMARRRHVSRAVTAQLVNTGEPSVLLNLVRNQNAEISHESFVQLVNVAANQEDLLAPLCIRADLPVPFAFELFWHAPAQLRRYLLSRFLTDSETLTKILKIALDNNGDEPAKPEFSNSEKIMEALQLADDGQLDEAAEILGAAAQINPATALRIMSDRQGEPLAALFKAVGITRAAANEILHGLKNSVSGLIDPARDPDELQGSFDSLSFNKARILLTYWDWATLKTGPYAPLN
jgi:uncharacterized protein (DUF2336 family)